MGGDLKKQVRKASILSYMQRTGEQLKDQNKVRTWNPGESANLSSHKTVGEKESCALLSKQIFLIIQKFKCVGICIFVDKLKYRREVPSFGSSHPERGPWFHLHNRMTLQLLWKA